MAKAKTDIRSLARSHTESAIVTLASIMNQPKANPSARVAAAQAILDRGWGKPKQDIDMTTRNGDLSDLLQQIREAGGDLTDDAGRTDGAPEVTH